MHLVLCHLVIENDRRKNCWYFIDSVSKAAEVRFRSVHGSLKESSILPHTLTMSCNYQVQGGVDPISLITVKNPHHNI
ncbi:hypothetical protein Mapa_004605 [Marchantia paleacea]|nr:hypothetical protein Mapa_004605 [Marchantia paleacea]